MKLVFKMNKYAEIHIVSKHFGINTINKTNKIIYI